MFHKKKAKQVAISPVIDLAKWTSEHAVLMKETWQRIMISWQPVTGGENLSLSLFKSDTFRRLFTGKEQIVNSR